MKIWLFPCLSAIIGSRCIYQPRKREKEQHSKNILWAFLCKLVKNEPLIFHSPHDVERESYYNITAP